MAVTINQLFEQLGLGQDALEQINEAWESRLQEAREEITSELREEFSQRYDHDKGLIVEAVDKFISERIANEMAELAEDKKSLAEQRVKYRKAVKEHAKILDQFVTKMVAKEVKELRADRQRVAEALNKMDTFVSTQLAEELTEFHQDKKALAEQRVKMIAEGKRQLAEAKAEFISRAAKKVERVVNKTMTTEVKTFREDITAARENDFGRRIYEAFASEFNASYLNEGREIKKFQTALAEMEKRLDETQSELAEQSEKVRLAESKLRAAKDRMVRKEKLDELMKPLSREKREIMSDLLESVKTDKLESAFNKYLPSLTENTSMRSKSTLTESRTAKEHTGNKKVAPAVAAAKTNEADDDTIVQLRKLAGLK